MGQLLQLFELQLVVKLAYAVKIVCVAVLQWQQVEFLNGGVNAISVQLLLVHPVMHLHPQHRFSEAFAVKREVGMGHVAENAAAREKDLYDLLLSVPDFPPGENDEAAVELANLFGEMVAVLLV